MVVGLAALSLLVSAAFASKASAVAAPPDFFGLTTVGQLYNEYEAGHAETLGVRNVRVDFVWSNVQTASCNGETATSGLDFSYDDRIVRNAAIHGVTVIANLYRSRASCNNAPFPAPGSTMYGAWKLQNSNGYVWSMVQRYGFNGRFWQENPGVPYRPIRIWEVWNEPNLVENNPGGRTIQPQQYAKLLVDTAATIRNAQEQQSGQPVSVTDTKVLMGGLVSDLYSPLRNAYAVADYIHTIFVLPNGYTAAQLSASFDGVSIHPYALTAGLSGVQQGISEARTVLDNHGEMSKTLWVTEVGWPVMSLSSTPTDYQQAQMLSETLPWINVALDIQQC